MVNVINAVKTAAGIWENVGSSLSVMRLLLPQRRALGSPVLTGLPALSSHSLLGQSVQCCAPREHSVNTVGMDLFE